MHIIDSLRGVSGGRGRGVLTRWPVRASQLADCVFLLDTLDGRVAELAGSQGIIALVGGITSHGAILARELGIPCVVATGNEAHEGLDAWVGLVVEVDGWDGQVRQVDAATEAK